MSNARKRYVLVGTGGRSVAYVDAVARTFKDVASLEAICDLSQTRMDWHNLRLREKFSIAPVPTYKSTDFDRMIREKRPDAVIVTTMDSTHHQYVIRAMELGCDVICEKPLTTDAAKARAIFETIQRTGRSLRMTFNARYVPVVTKVRELMLQGVVGRPKLVAFSWMLDTAHGADYFHRWHGEKDKSGGLLVHKATHHFDMANWWIGSYPKSVYAQGDLMFYGKKAAEARGESYSYDRYTGHPEAKGDPFAVFLDEPRHRDPALSVPSFQGLYLNAEKETGYIRDRNVFGAGITIEDTMALTVRYRNGAIMSYSLVAFSPWEGYQVAITGDRGRLEVLDVQGSHIIRGQDTEQLAAEMGHSKTTIRVYPMFGEPYDVEVPKADGPHGGGDKVLLEDLFNDDPTKADPLGRAATHLDGAASILIGISANESIRTALPIQCDDLLKLPDV